MLDWFIFDAITNFFDQLKKSWENDFIPQFLIGFRVFLLLLLAVIIAVLVILVIKIFHYFSSGGSKSKGTKNETTNQSGGEDKK